MHKKKNGNMHSSIWHFHILILSLDKDQQRKYIYLLTHVNVLSRKLWKCNSFQNLLRMKYMTSKEQSEGETCTCHMVFSQYYTIVGTFWAYILIFPRYLILTNDNHTDDSKYKHFIVYCIYLSFIYLVYTMFIFCQIYHAWITLWILFWNDII